MLRILTDRGTEFCGRLENHDYQQCLAMHDIERNRTRAASPQNNGICEHFHKTNVHEFYQVAFRTIVYESLEQLKSDLDNHE
jgi:transposase InsO family protein